MYNILIAEDEAKIREAMFDYLSAKGFNVTTAANGEEALQYVDFCDFDLIILDVMMPVMNGLSACRVIRAQSDVPILFLSALGEERDFLNGYSSGADDYIVKPFPLSVLNEKCTAMIKRSKGINKENKLSASGITLDLNLNRVFTEKGEIELSGKDYQILKYLMENKGIILSRELILNKIWGYDFYGDTRVVDTHIKIIRKALKEKADCVKTVFNAGYTFKEV